MKTINILLEGDKDVHFLHEFILRRFPVFPRATNRIPDLRRLASVEMVNGDGSVRIVLYKMGGYKTLANHCDLLVPRADVAGEFAAVVIFDSDYPGGNGQGGQSDRRASLKRMAKESSRNIDLIDDHLFLLPDNRDDGDLEVLMERMIADTDQHRSFLETCWRNFEDCVRRHGFNQTSQKSKLNEYAAAFNAGTWHDGGINAAFMDDALWNWNSPSLTPLYEFLNRLLAGGHE